MSSVEIQKELCDMLKYLVELLEKNKIKYFISSGTCLGTIRHKGFIPWDNDIDIFVPREEYYKISNLPVEDKYEITNPYKKDYLCTYSKFVNKKIRLEDHDAIKKYSKQNLFIDIFPLDYLPDNDKKRNRLVKNVYKLKILLSCKGTKGSTKKKDVLKKIYRILFFWLPINVLKKVINNSGVKYKTEHCMDLCWGKTPLLTKFFEDYEIKEFEGIPVRVPKMYHEYLTTIYGDYMKLPPVEKRVSHNIDAYYIEGGEKDE